MKTSMKFNLSLLVFVMSLGIAHATPWFTQDPKTLPQGGWRFEEHMMYSGADSGLADGAAATLPGGLTDSSTLIMQTRLRYGVTDKLTVFGDLPYVRQEIELASGDTGSNSGLGDITLLAKYQYHNDQASRHRRALAVFYKLENGDSNAAPALLSLGTGQENIGLIHLWEWDRSKVNWYANLGYVWTGELDSGKNPGDVILFNLAAEHRLGQTPWRFVWELNGQLQGKSDLNGAGVAQSGATTIYFTPGFQWVGQKHGSTVWNWETGVQLPLYEKGFLPAAQDYKLYAGGYVMF